MNASLEIASLAGMLGWLALVIVGYSSYRLSWKKSVTMALVWAAIFVGVVGLVVLLRSSAGVGEAIGSFL